jgi:hypothetical protein
LPRRRLGRGPIKVPLPSPEKLTLLVPKPPLRRGA